MTGQNLSETFSAAYKQGERKPSRQLIDAFRTQTKRFCSSALAYTCDAVSLDNGVSDTKPSTGLPNTLLRLVCPPWFAKSMLLV